MVKSISKKCFSILMILVLMFSVFTIPVHSEVITMTTAVGVTVVAAALVAAGIYIASPNTRQAINDAALDFINREATFLQTVKVVATATGKVFAMWGSNMWNKFTNWIQNFLLPGAVTISGYALPIVSQWPSNTPFRTAGFNSLGVASATSVFTLGGCHLIKDTSTNLFYLNAANGIFKGGTNISGACYVPTIGFLGNWEYRIYQAARNNGGSIQTVSDTSLATQFLVRTRSIGTTHTVYGTDVTFSLGNDGWIYGNGHKIARGFPSIYHYLVAVISAGIFFGDYSWITGGANVPADTYYNPTVTAQPGSNAAPGYTIDPATGSIGGSLPITANPGQTIIIPMWGTWTNGDGIPIGWAGPQGTYGTPSGTITPGTTIAGTGTGTANPPVTYPGDDVINPTLGRKGVATFPTIGDDVINPADDTFITDLDDYIDPTIDQLTTPTDVSTLTQNPTDVVGPTTDVYPESDDIPNSIRDTATDTIPDVDSPAIPDVDTATDTANPINPDAPDDTSNDERNTNRLKLSTLILSKFPFCIPWDIYRTVATMVQEPEIPSFDWRFSLPSFNVDETIHIDFEQFETVAYIVRWFLSACWLVTLVLLTRKVIWK